MKHAFNISVSFTNDNYCTIAITYRTTLLQLDTVRILTIVEEEEEENDNEENVTSYLICLSVFPSKP